MSEFRPLSSIRYLLEMGTIETLNVRVRVRMNEFLLSSHLLHQYKMAESWLSNIISFQHH